jgi:hypothetical protein
MTSIDYRIFDDLLIGNFMKTTLHGLDQLNAPPAEFNYSVAKYGDNGQAETEAENTQKLEDIAIDGRGREGDLAQLLAILWT